MEHMDRWLREQCRNILDQKISDSTKEQYRTVGLRLEKTRSQLGEHVDLSAYVGNAKTFYAYRAATRFYAAEEGRKAISAYDKATKQNDAIAKAEAWQKIVMYAADLVRYPKDSTPGLPNNTEIKLGLTDKKQAGEPAEAKKNGVAAIGKSTSKLSDANAINKKYPEWKYLLWEHFSTTKSHWLDQVAVSSLTGCRPAELNDVDIQQKNGMLVITIPGAKVREFSGQPWRRFTIKNDGSAEFKHLFDLAEHTSNIKSHGLGDDAFSAALSYAGKKVLPKAPRMSAYVYRHSLAADLKADKCTREQIAAALGQAVTKTQDTYGRAKGGRSQTRTISVEAARTIKVTHDPRYTTESPENAPADLVAPMSETFNTPGFDL
jgi:integrase